MEVVNEKDNLVYIFSLCTILITLFPLTILSQTVDTSDDSVVQNALLSFSIDKTPLHVGDTFTLHLNIENITDLAGWQCDLEFDPTILEANEVLKGDFLDVEDVEAFFQAGTIDNAIGKITDLSSARLVPGGMNGTGRLFSIAFTTKTIGDTQVILSNLKAGTSGISKEIPLNIPEIIITVEEQTEPDNETTISMFTDKRFVRVGDTFTLHLNVNNIIDLSRWQCDIVFDPDVLEAVEVIEGDFLKEGNITTFFLNNNIDNTLGKITGLGTVRLNSDGVNGSGKLLSIVFNAKNTGQVQVTLTNLFAYSSDSAAIPLDIPVATITVSEISSAILSFSTDKNIIRVDDTFTLHLNVEDATDLAGWLCDITFDPSKLEVVEVSEGDFLTKEDRKTFFLSGIIDNAAGNITAVGSVSLSKNVMSGMGRLVSVTFIARAIGETRVKISNIDGGTSNLLPISLNTPELSITVEERIYLPWDVNKDGEVNILDLMLVAQYLGKDAAITPQADVDSDGTIGILDLIAIAQNLGATTASAPPPITKRFVDVNPSYITDNKELNQETIRAWITQAQMEDDGSIVFRMGIANLQRLLISSIPEKTTLLANYPNPFNPETWIPYYLTEAAEVTVFIYSINGTIIRTISLGYQDAGAYKSRNRAVHWDGKNDIGEPVASGIYFYTLTAGDFTATKKMVIKK